MTVHIGQVTSEVRSSAPVRADAVAEEQPNVWEQRHRTAALVERVGRDLRRTATGCGDD
jgi:hypothetical protein